jgi:POT family proton-dependent oligopeptide transporter
LLPIYAFVVVFWALFDQTGSAWVLQAEHMNLDWLGHEWLASEIGMVNPILVLMFVPLFSYLVYPAIDRVFPLTPLRKVGVGFFLAALAFVVSAAIEIKIQAGTTPTIAWQLLAYAVLTAAEVMVSITCLEFSYTQAPRKLKSFIMALYLLSVSVGNMLTATVNEAIQNADGTSKLPGADYYWFFAGLMAATAVLFIFVAMRYREQTYIQQEQPPAEQLAES